MHKQKFQQKYGPWALVTGASSGIGRQIALGLAQKGLHLILVARSGLLLAETANLVRAQGVKAEVLVADFEQPQAVEEVLTTTSQHEVGLLVPAAGFGDAGLFAESSLALQTAMLQVNIISVMALTHHFARRMQAQGHGGIILISSLLAFHGTPYNANYAATKAYVQTLGEALAIEFKGTGVDVLVSSPGPTDTGFGQRANMQMRRAMTAQEVATSTLNALGHSSTVLPGTMTKLLRGALMTAPRFLQIRIIGTIMKGFAQKH